jgi:purine-nucleoside phosphorylase
MRVAAVCNITNLASGLTAAPLSHAQTLEKAAIGAAALARLLAGVLETL